ncbi:MAG TPA: phosphopantetheine-binding protein [Candidatus Binatia bacterium]|jgi:acyl carrier protein|nr:phosphopantetheine-binding protein [Candidatus Binatia bacterium]
MSTQSILTSYIEEELVHGHRDLTANEDLLSTGVLNSLSILKLVGFIEDRFEIRIPDEDIVFENFQSIERLSDYLEQSKIGGH